MTKKNWLERLRSKNHREPLERIYDPETGEVESIPLSSLKQGWVHADVEGIEGYVWIDPKKLQLSPIVHEQLDPVLVTAIQEIRETFLEHRNITLAEWEDGFKRDQNPASEISLWLNAARTYSAMVDELTTFEARDELYTLIIVCLNSPEYAVKSAFRPSALDSGFVERVTSFFYTPG